VPRVQTDETKVTVMLMFSIANALLLAHVLTTERIPEPIAKAIWQPVPSPGSRTRTASSESHRTASDEARLSPLQEPRPPPRPGTT
jgi:hypothetical protein